MGFVHWMERTGATRRHHHGLARGLVLLMFGAAKEATRVAAGGTTRDGIVGGGTYDDAPKGGHLHPSNHLTRQLIAVAAVDVAAVDVAAVDVVVVVVDVAAVAVMVVGGVGAVVGVSLLAVAATVVVVALYAVEPI